MRNFITLVIATILVVGMTLDEPPEASQKAKVAQVSKDIPKEPVKAVVEAPVQPQPILTGCDAVRAEVSKYKDWDVNLMVAISQAESSCRVDALGDTSLKYEQFGRTYGYSVSVFQVRILPGREHCDRLDLEVNVKCAYGVWVNQGYRAWSVYGSGRYLDFLRQ